MVTKTIAILAEKGKISPELLRVLGKSNLRLLFVAENEENKNQLVERLQPLGLKAEIDFTSCGKEGCWEADKILLLRSAEPSEVFIDQIKEVATQKPVWVVSEETETKDQADLKRLLPNSKVIEIKFKKKKKEVSICGKDAEARDEIRQLFEASGYAVSSTI